MSDILWLETEKTATVSIHSDDIRSGNNPLGRDGPTRTKRTVFGQDGESIHDDESWRKKRGQVRNRLVEDFFSSMKRLIVQVETHQIFQPSCDPGAVVLFDNGQVDKGIVFLRLPDDGRFFKALRLRKAHLYPIFRRPGIMHFSARFFNRLNDPRTKPAAGAVDGSNHRLGCPSLKTEPDHFSHERSTRADPWSIPLGIGKNDHSISPLDKVFHPAKRLESFFSKTGKRISLGNADVR